ncbi:MAG TPA: integrin alpha, partial [Candidatus Saccharimonadales bacterium]|nr:integrin alpha [Candidatus Saccharimonadales bacterium]
TGSAASPIAPCPNCTTSPAASRPYSAGITPENGRAPTSGTGTLNGYNGFVINGNVANYRLGAFVATGDINDDGLADVAVSDNYNYGSLYVILGRQLGGAKWSTGPSDSTHNWPSPLDLSTYFDGYAGFQITNVKGGVAFVDLNGDSFQDLAFNGPWYANPPDAYVLWGQKLGSSWSSGPSNTAHNWSASYNAISMPANCCLHITDSNGNTPYVESAGDFNADGVADLALGEPYATINGNVNTGQAYVLYGSKSSMPSSIDLPSLTHATGLKIVGCTAGEYAGGTVTGGDINGDSYSDLMIGAPLATYNNNANAGIGYVIYGKKTRSYDSLSLCCL